MRMMMRMKRMRMVMRMKRMIRMRMMKIMTMLMIMRTMMIIKMMLELSLSGHLVTSPCPGSAAGQAARECGLGGWGAPQLGDCRSDWLTGISRQYRAGRNILSITRDLLNTFNR